MKRKVAMVAISFEGVIDVHAAPSHGAYATLCGLDGNDSDVQQSPAELPQDARIACTDCWKVVAHSRLYSPSHFDAKAVLG